MEITPSGAKNAQIVITTESLWQLHDWQETLIRAQQYYFLLQWNQRQTARAKRQSIIAAVRTHPESESE
jgi:hypothetical protein